MDYTMPEFLAHAIALEHEAAERYQELADMMQAHHNDYVAALFRDMVRYSRMHRDSIIERARGVALPTLHPGQYRWLYPPEAGGTEALDHRIDAHAALNHALRNEMRGLDYYCSVGEQTTDAEIRLMASEFAAEETEHVQALEDWLARTPPAGAPLRGAAGRPVAQA